MDIRPGTQTCPSVSWPAWPPLPGWPSRGPPWRCWSGACQMGHSLPGFAGKLPQRALGPAPSWGACLLAGCTGEEAWRESSADTVTGETYIVSTVTDATPRSLSSHQQVHLCFSWTWAVQRLPASVDRVLHLLPEENSTTVMMQQMP